MRRLRFPACSRCTSLYIDHSDPRWRVTELLAMAASSERNGALTDGRSAVPGFGAAVLDVPGCRTPDIDGLVGWQPGRQRHQQMEREGLDGGLVLAPQGSQALVDAVVGVWHADLPQQPEQLGRRWRRLTAGHAALAARPKDLPEVARRV